ncbi:MAG: transposase [Gammaproteobacteria bacterium]
MRTLSRPSTANCTLPMYIGFLLSEPNAPSCCRLAEVMEISHDSVNRFLQREAYTPLDLFQESKRGLALKGGTLSVDDSVLDKPYSHHMDLVGYFWSGKHHRVVKGINLITLYYTDVHGQHRPVNYRLYDKAEGKTKNDYFQDMLAEVRAWGLEPAVVAWYSGVDNLKRVRNHSMGFLFALESNRRIAVAKGLWEPVQHLEVPEEGRVVWLRGFGQVKLYRTWLKDQRRHYAVYLPDGESLASFDRAAFLQWHDQHWQIEQYHRAIKQVCHVEHCQVRGQVPIANHIFSAICGYIQLQRLCAMDLIRSCYRLQRDLFNGVVASFIRAIIPHMESLNSQFQPVVNA